MLEPVLLAAKILFLVLLYLFIYRIVRGLAKDLSRGAEPISMPARPASDMAPEHAGAAVAAPPAPGSVATAGNPAPPARTMPPEDSSTREFDYLYSKLKPRLVVQHSKVVEDGQVYEIRGGVTIGRSPASQISLPDEYVSSTHARVFARKQFFFLEDLGSTNGTYIDGRRVEGERQIKPGQEIVIGDTIFRYEE
ncbi:MAG: FHA domain-containing protein [Thermoleophilia bacterium]|nr:FHA domain-containing protein [Thermoleophilia bacterium]